MDINIVCTASVILILLILVAVNGCIGTNSSSSPGATINLSVADTPVDEADSVVVAFTGVVLMGPDGQTSFKFATEQTLDLLKLHGNISAKLLNGIKVPAGNYQWLRLDVDVANSYVISSTGGKYPLNIPSGSQSGLKLVSGFTLAQGDIANFMIDFYLRQGLTLDNSGGTTTYTLKPAQRLINLQQVGMITGMVSSSLNIGGNLITDNTCSPAVYVYLGSNVITEGYDVAVSGGSMPITSSSISLDATTGNYAYTVGFLAPGTYTLAVTCAAMDTDGSQTLAFSPSQNASVMANSTIIINF